MKIFEISQNNYKLNDIIINKNEIYYMVIYIKLHVKY